MCLRARVFSKARHGLQVCTAPAHPWAMHTAHTCSRDAGQHSALAAMMSFGQHTRACSKNLQQVCVVSPF